MSDQTKIREQAHEDAANHILRALAKEDLLFAHHCTVHARPGAYKRLADYYASSNALREVATELRSAREKFPRRQSGAHEGYAVLKEEVDELWDEVKGKHPDRRERMRAEAIQVAAMAIRFVEKVCDDG